MVDDTDRRIVNALLEDGRADVRELAERSGVAATTVSRRLEELRNRGVLGGIVPVVADEAFGYELTVVFQFGVDSDSLQAVVDALGSHDRMVDVYEVTGRFDVVAVGKFVDTDEMHDQVGELSSRPGVERVSVNVVRETVREHGQFPVPVDDA